MNEIIEFKSNDDYFECEKSGLKNWTVRKIDLSDERFQVLLKMWKTKDYGKILINRVNNRVKFSPLSELDKAINPYFDKEDSFMRCIQHICIWETLIGITWEVKKKNEGQNER